jgi:hypothetical protein
LPRRKQGGCVGTTTRGTGTTWMVGGDDHGLPLGHLLDAASPAEGPLSEPPLATLAVPRPRRGRPRQRPERRIADSAGEADARRQRLPPRGIVLLCPPRQHRKKPPRPDGRKVRRYKRRGKGERPCAWWGNCRRVLGRWERPTTMDRAFFPGACLLITLTKL